MNVNFPHMNQGSMNQALPGNLLSTNRTYSSFNQKNQVLINYGETQTKVYDKQFSGMENGGKISIDELKETIKKEFPVYKMVSNEPADVVEGQHLLYIDKNNLQKMADDAGYRAKVFGLMRREGDSSTGTTNVRLNGNMESFRTTGTVFSLSDKNENVGGIPYKGSARSMSMSSSTMSTSNRLSTGKDEDWYEKLLERIRERREETEAHLADVQKRLKEEKPTEVNVYI
ncbi:hypothetical protein [uncultured Desulfobacter sp.]|uniref:hypothetical protein n=1 Tax=uncultured Desulfobacter sp. TaxID=240139 RepID=UPI002AAC4453|nr:hypothetical protein [uncultured Desulfobacter sp.]